MSKKNKKDLGQGFLFIKDFARLAGIAITALRYYDKIGLFKPYKRGTEFVNKYRSYAPTQITAVKMIRVLTEIGVPLKTIKDATRNRTPEIMLKLLSDNKNRVADEIRFLQGVCSVISVFIELLNEGMSVNEAELSVCEMSERRLVMGGINNFDGTVGFFNEYARFCDTPYVNLNYPIGGYSESMAAFLDHPSQPTRFFSLDPNGSGARSAGLYLNGYTRGYYGQVNDLPERMTAFAKENGLIFSGAVYQTYLFDEISIADPNNLLLQVSASVTETRRVSSRRPRRHL